uniref:ER membrane protein complex subunit 1 n=1 Tax=Talaromyces marneffei PM1 TaxID=1077442 RepID=A0A093UV28_TALMA
MWFKTAIVLLAACALPSSAVFVDEVDYLDFHHALLGTPSPQSTFFHQPSSSSNASLLYTLSEKSIIGAVNPRDGAIVWRQDLTQLGSTQSVESFLRASNGEATVVSAIGEKVAAWGASNGKLHWERKISGGVVKDLELLELEDGRTNNHARDVIVLSEGKGGLVQRLDATTGTVKWEFKDESGDVPFQVSSSATEVFYISLQSALLKGYKIKVTTLDTQTGKQKSQLTLASENDVSGPESVLLVGSNTASPFIAWADKSNKTLKVNIIGSKNVINLEIENTSNEEIRGIKIYGPTGLNCLPHFLVACETDSSSWAEVYHIDLQTFSISQAYRLPRISGKSVFSASHRAGNVFFTRITETEISVYSSTSHGILGRWPFTKSGHGSPISAVAEVINKGDSAAVRFAYVLDSGDWQLNRNGGNEWTRHESLSGAVAAAWVEPNISEDLVHELELEGHEDVLSAYIHRVKRHVRDLEHLPAYLQELPQRIFSSFLAAEATNLDSFGLRKLVIMATEKGRAIAVDTGNHGAVVWNVKVVDTPDWKVKAIKSDLGTVTIYVEDGSTVSLNVTSGSIVSQKPSGALVRSVAVVPTEAGINAVAVPIAEDGTPLQSLQEAGYLVTLSEDGRVLGWDLSNNKVPVWQFLPPAGERVISATSRPAHDPVASIGKVLGDRSVLYKYLNQNLALITSIGPNIATFYLLDSVSGQVLHSSTHTGVDVTQPITSIISENWFAYSLWADLSNESESKGYQLIVSELYESPLPNDRGPLGAAANYSSLDGTDTYPKPYVVSQAFIIPEPISHLAVTQTRQGITIRQLLCTLPESNAIVGIPHHVLDPRRPVGRDPTPAEVEEGLFKYSPNLEFDGRWYITHSRDVAGIRAVIVSPTLLESTGLVFAFGGDVFGSRVAPSQAFDILGRSFAKLQLLGTVVALAVGVWFLAPIARRKQINLLWKR